METNAMRLDEARRTGYFRMRSASERERYLSSAWFHICEEMRVPYLVVEPARKPFALVNLDSISCHYSSMLSAEGCRRIRAVLCDAAVPRPLRKQPQDRLQYENRALDVSGGGPPNPGKSIWCSRIPRERADEIAQAIAAIVRDEMIPIPLNWRSA